jgi:hypothetical protein
MYKSPITVAEELCAKATENIEGRIMAKLTQTLAVDVDKGELLKALEYDRGQYDKGYKDGYLAGEKAAREKFTESFTRAIRHAMSEWNDEHESKE